MWVTAQPPWQTPSRHGDLALPISQGLFGNATKRADAGPIMNSTATEMPQSKILGVLQNGDWTVLQLAGLRGVHPPARGTLPKHVRR